MPTLCVYVCVHVRFCGKRSRSHSRDSRSRSVDSRDRKHHSHKKSKKRHRSRSPDSPYQSYSAPVEKHKKVRIGQGETREGTIYVKYRSLVGWRVVVRGAAVAAMLIDLVPGLQYRSTWERRIAAEV